MSLGRDTCAVCELEATYTKARRDKELAGMVGRSSLGGRAGVVDVRRRGGGWGEG